MGAHEPVLIVDDDGELARLISQLLQAAGLSTLHLSDGDRVLDLAIEQQPALILLDIGLPRADGRDLLRGLKAHARTFHIPVFIHTGRSNHADRLAALELGADDYIEKPFDPTLLARRIVYRIAKVAVEDDGTPSEADRRSSQNLRIARQERLSQGKIRLTSTPGRPPILVVEDDNNLRQCICDILEDEGLDAWPARNGQEALDLLHKRSLRPSLILLDHSMPDMDGAEFQDRLFRDRTIPPTPVVIMSDAGPDAGKGSGSWLQKPIDFADLLSVVSEATG